MQKLAILIVLAVILTSSESAQSIQENSIQTPAGWLLPKQTDLKGQWSEKYWTDECDQAKAAAKKSATDAIEEIGDLPSRGVATGANENVECWKPDFPVDKGFGDYNGDGIQDEARILISTTKRGSIGFFAFLKSRSAKVNVIRILTIADAKPQNHFIGALQPGEKIETACGKGYWDCGTSEPKSITLRWDRISFGLFESWSSVAYWDSRLNKFRVVAISD